MSADEAAAPPSRPRKRRTRPGEKLRGAEKLGTTLRTQMGDALLYRFLAQLRFDVPLTETLADLEWKGVLRKPFAELCDELGFDRLEGRVQRWAD